MLTYDKYSEYRDRKGLSNYKVSLLTGIPRTTFCAWGSGEYEPKLNTLLRLAKVLKIPPREIVSKDDIRNAELKPIERAKDG